MSGWNKFNAVVYDKKESRTFAVIVWGVTKKTAYDKLRTEYPASKYDISGLGEASK